MHIAARLPPQEIFVVGPLDGLPAGRGPAEDHGSDVGRLQAAGGFGPFGHSPHTPPDMGLCTDCKICFSDDLALSWPSWPSWPFWPSRKIFHLGRSKCSHETWPPMASVRGAVPSAAPARLQDMHSALGVEILRVRHAPLLKRNRSGSHAVTFVSSKNKNGPHAVSETRATCCCFWLAAKLNLRGLRERALSAQNSHAFPQKQPTLDVSVRSGKAQVMRFGV